MIDKYNPPGNIPSHLQLPPSLPPTVLTRLLPRGLPVKIVGDLSPESSGIVDGLEGETEKGREGEGKCQ